MGLNASPGVIVGAIAVFYSWTSDCFQSRHLNDRNSRKILLSVESGFSDKADKHKINIILNHYCFVNQGQNLKIEPNHERGHRGAFNVVEEIIWNIPMEEGKQTSCVRNYPILIL